MAEARIEMSAADKNVLELIKSISGGFDKLVASQERLEAASKKSSEAAQGGLDRIGRSVDGALTNVMRLAAGWVSVGTAVRIANDQIKHNEELNKRASQAALGAVEGQRQTVMAFAPDASMPNVDAMVAAAEAMAKRQKIPVTKLYDVLPASYSAKGGLSIAQANAATEAAIALSPNAPASEMNVFTGAAFDMMGAMQGKATPQQALGMIIAGQQTSRVTNPAAYATNVAGPNKQLIGMGNTHQEAIALTSALAVATADTTGSQSANAAVNLGLQLKQRLAGVDGLKGATLQQQLAYLQGNPEGQKILAGMTGSLGSQVKAGVDPQTGTLSGEAKAKMSMIQILEGRGEAADLFRGNLGKIPDLAGMGQIYESKRAELASLELQKFGASQQSADATRERWKLAGGHKYSGNAAERFDQLMQDIPGTTWSERASANYSYGLGVHVMGENPAEAGAEIFRSGARGMLFSGGDQYRTPDQMSQTERAKYDKFLEAVELMLEVAKMQKEAIQRPTVEPNGERRQLPGAR